MTDTDTPTRHPYGARLGRDHQPLSAIRWVDRNELHANGYNPNHVAPKEMRLLKISILSDGWTQPIVARSDGEIVDGFHRWTTSADPDVGALTGGLVPVVFLPDDTPTEHQMMSTVRHNRARGSHHVVKMADIVLDLLDLGLGPDEVAERMQMDPEEVRRLSQRGSMRERHGEGDFNNGFRFVAQEDEPDDEGRF